MAAVTFRGRSLRSRRLRGRPDSGEENVTLDYSKGTAENIKEILNSIVSQKAASKAKSLGYFNAFVRLCYRSGNDIDYGMSTEDLLCCLRVGMFHEAKEMRAACMRALRYMCRDKSTVETMLQLHIDYLIARSLDICLDNEIERIHAVRLIRKMMLVHPQKFPVSLLNAMVSIANDGTKERDKMVRSCLATLCELAYLNPSLVLQSGAFSAILRSVLDSYHLPRINESLLATVLYLLNHPSTRQYIKLDIELEQLLAPFTDCHYRFSPDSADKSAGEERENRFAASKMAIATVIRSWPGIIWLCRPDGSGLQSLLGVLYLPHMETRKEIMDILYDVFRVPVPEWTDDFNQALVSVDPSEMRDSWRLTEGFVAAEGKAILPHISKTRPDLVDNHLSLILSAFISTGLLEALVEVIATSDIHVCVRGTILLGEILHMANNILPFECNQTSHCLPTLISRAASYTTSHHERQQANMAVTCLSRLHALKKRGPVPCSLYLDQILQSASRSDRDGVCRPLKLQAEKLNQCLPKPLSLTGQAESAGQRHRCLPSTACLPFQCAPFRTDAERTIIAQAIQDSQVLKTKDNFNWDWHLISAILKWPDEQLRLIEDQSNQRFIRRLVHFFKPSTKLFSSIELTREDARKFSIVGCHLVDFLLECAETEGAKYWEDWLADIKQCINQITAQRAPQDALFTPSYLNHTVSQDYFLFLGRFSASVRGDKILEKAGVYQALLDLMTITSHDTYVKLIVSSLDYTKDGLARIILSKGLTATSESARLYTARFLRVLLRARVPFLSNWGMELLIMQLYDQSRAVAMEALSVISEACEDEVNLQKLVALNPSVIHLGYKGCMLLARFLSIPAGFRLLKEANYVAHELDKWHQSFNVKYVGIVEERLNEALTTYEKTYDGSYTRRSVSRQPRKDVFVPVHLYGQLVQHKAGCDLLAKQEYILEYFNCIRCLELKTEEQVLKLKAALWAVGHMGTAVWGLGVLQDENIIPEVIKLAEDSDVFSIRGTAFFVLGLISSTTKGADILKEYGWESVRHSRCDLWPIILDNYPDTDTDAPLHDSNLSLASSAKSEAPLIGQAAVGSYLLERKETGYHSPSGSSPSPKASFFIEGEVYTKSRSNTETSLPPVIPSPSESPQKDSGVNLEPVMDMHLDTPYSEPRVRSVTSASQAGYHTGDDDVDQSSQSLPDTHRQTNPLSGNSVPEIQLIHVDHNKEGSPTDPELPPKGQSERYKVLIADKSRSLEKDLLRQRAASIRDDRSSSNADSWTTKSRSNSMNTDTTTSGVGSVESGPNYTVDYPLIGPLLSPIPSASSVTTDANRSQQELDDSASSVHPSDTLRRMMNFKRVPSVKRRYSNPVLGHLSPLKAADSRSSVGDNMLGYTSQRDAQGYAALRELQRARTASMEADPALDLSELDDPFTVKTRNTDYRLGSPRSGLRQKPGFATLPAKFPFSPSSFRRKLTCAIACTRNQSYTSMPELEPQPSGNSLYQLDSIPRNLSRLSLKRAPTPTKLTLLVTNNRAESVGICLPVDVHMLFHVTEEEDRMCTETSLPEKLDTALSASHGHLTKIRSISQSDEDVLENHSPQTCLACYQRGADITVQVDTVDQEGDDEAFISGTKPTGVAQMPIPSVITTPITSAGPSPSVAGDLAKRGVKSRNSSMSEMLTGLPSSMTSNTSIESSAKHLMSEESDFGRIMIRKEVLRLIINLSSSVGVKSSEQGLLILRQKFAQSFQDICLYSEVCYLLANYNYRLTARRFIQELFHDMTFSQLLKEPKKILGLPEETENANTEIPKELFERLDKVDEALRQDSSLA